MTDHAEFKSYIFEKARELENFVYQKSNKLNWEGYPKVISDLLRISDNRLRYMPARIGDMELGRIETVLKTSGVFSEERVFEIVAKLQWGSSDEEAEALAKVDARADEIASSIQKQANEFRDLHRAIVDKANDIALLIKVEAK
jgi:hypothetical protein